MSHYVLMGAHTCKQTDTSSCITLTIVQEVGYHSGHKELTKREPSHLYKSPIHQKSV